MPSEYVIQYTVAVSPTLICLAWWKITTATGKMIDIRTPTEEAHIAWLKAMTFSHRWYDSPVPEDDEGDGDKDDADLQDSGCDSDVRPEKSPSSPPTAKHQHSRKKPAHNLHHQYHSSDAEEQSNGTSSIVNSSTGVVVGKRRGLFRAKMASQTSEETAAAMAGPVPSTASSTSPPSNPLSVPAQWLSERLSRGPVSKYVATPNHSGRVGVSCNQRSGCTA